MLPQELNLKAFLKKENKLVKIQSIDFITNKITYTTNIFNNDEQVACYKTFEANFNDIELIQCTNQKDKNGNFIYEGDIVKIDVKYEILTAEIKFGNKEYKWSTNDAYGFYVDFGTQELKSEILFWIKKYGVEVVGNIYENKELLCQK